MRNAYFAFLRLELEETGYPAVFHFAYPFMSQLIFLYPSFRTERAASYELAHDSP